MIVTIADCDSKPAPDQHQHERGSKAPSCGLMVSSPEQHARKDRASIELEKAAGRAAPRTRKPTWPHQMLTD